jgi:hypothetical protein
LRKIIIALPEELFSELQAASADIHEMGFTPERWAQEAVESVLATRRLPRVRTSVQCGRHNGASVARDAERKSYESEPHAAGMESL